MNILAATTHKAHGPTGARHSASAPSVNVVRTARQATDRLREAPPDVFLFDATIPGLSGQDFLKRLRKDHPQLSIVFVPDATQVEEGALARALKRGATTARARSRRAGEHTVPSMHDPRSGRIDARRVGRFLGLSQSEVARIFRRTPQALHKTPDAAAIQDGLAILLRITSALTTLFGEEAKARVWLNAPHPDLDHTQPLDLIRKRKANIVAELLEDALLGHPG